MPRIRRLTLAALNITTEAPHSPDRYRKLFSILRDASPPFSGTISKRDKLMLEYYGETGDLLTGAFAAYTHIDHRSPWWDTIDRKALIDDKGEPIPQVREGIGPNLRSIYFMMFTEEHRLVFDSREISPAYFAKGIRSIFSSPIICNEFGTVNVTVEPEQDLLKQIVNTPHKKKVTISFSLPNSDVTSQLQQNIIERFNRAGIASTKQEFSAQQGKDVIQDDEMIAAMEIASSNGYVEIIAQGEDGKNFPLSTKDHPKLLSELHEPSQYWQTFTKNAKQLVQMVRGLNGK